MKLNIDPVWLLRMVEKEDCRIVSVGGFVTRAEEVVRRPAQSMRKEEV